MSISPHVPAARNRRKTCGRCVRRSLLRRYYRAPEALRNRLQRTSAPAARPRASMRWLAMAAGILLMLGAAAAAGVFLSRGRTSADDRVAEWIAASHIRSLQVEHLTDVASADGHKVKPWFRG